MNQNETYVFATLAKICIFLGCCRILVIRSCGSRRKGWKPLRELTGGSQGARPLSSEQGTWISSTCQERDLNLISFILVSSVLSYLIRGHNFRVETRRSRFLASVCVLVCVSVCVVDGGVFLPPSGTLKLICKRALFIGLKKIKCLCELSIPKTLRNIIEMEPKCFFSNSHDLGLIFSK